MIQQYQSFELKNTVKSAVARMWKLLLWQISDSKKAVSRTCPFSISLSSTPSASSTSREYLSWGLVGPLPSLQRSYTYTSSSQPITGTIQQLLNKSCTEPLQTGVFMW